MTPRGRYGLAKPAVGGQVRRLVLRKPVDSTPEERHDMFTTGTNSAAATSRRYTVRYGDYPPSMIPGTLCQFCGSGQVWTDGLVLCGEAADGSWLPACDDCLEQSNPALLELREWLWALWRLAGSGEITAAVIEQR